MREDGEKERNREKVAIKQGKRKRRGGQSEKERCSGGQGCVDECVSPIVFTKCHPSNKSFKRGIRRKVKAKQRGDAEG